MYVVWEYIMGSLLIYMYESMMLWYLIKTNDGLCIHEIVQSMDEDVDDATAYGNHPCEDNEDGNMMIKRSIKGSLQAATTISAS